MSYLGEVANYIWSVLFWLADVLLATVVIRGLRRRDVLGSLMFAAIAVILFHSTLDGPLGSLLGATLTSTIDWICLGLLYLILILFFILLWMRRRRLNSAQR